MVAWVAASGGIAEDVRLRKRASRSLTKTGCCGHIFFVLFLGSFSVAFWDEFFKGIGLVFEAIWLHFGGAFWLLCWTLRKMRDPTKVL